MKMQTVFTWAAIKRKIHFLETQQIGERVNGLKKQKRNRGKSQTMANGSAKRRNYLEHTQFVEIEDVDVRGYAFELNDHLLDFT